jgi:hypothetical protein
VSADPHAGTVTVACSPCCGQDDALTFAAALWATALLPGDVVLVIDDAADGSTPRGSFEQGLAKKTLANLPVGLH